MSIHISPLRPDPICTSHLPSYMRHTPSPSSSNTTATTSPMPPHTHSDTNSSFSRTISRGGRRRTPCIELVDGARLATELASKAVAILMCCVLLTLTAKSSSSSSSSSPSSTTSTRHSSRSTSTNHSPTRRQHIPSTPTRGSGNTSDTQQQQQQQQQPRSNTQSPPAHGQHQSRPSVGQGELDSSTLPRRSTYYETLLVPSHASQVEIKSAHRRLAIRYHPDKYSRKDAHLSGGLSPAQAQSMFIMVQEAYEVLSDPHERKRYDYALSHDLRYKRLATGGSILEYYDIGTSTTSPSSQYSSTTSTRQQSRRESYDATAFTNGFGNGSPMPGGSSHPRRPPIPTYLALPLAFISIFILRPFTHLGLNVRLKKLRSHCSYYCTPFLRTYTFLKRIYQRVCFNIRRLIKLFEKINHIRKNWTILDYIMSFISLGWFIVLYVPIRIMCIWQRCKRIIRAIYSTTTTNTRDTTNSDRNDDESSHSDFFDSSSSSSSSSSHHRTHSTLRFKVSPPSASSPADSTSSESSSPTMSTSSSVSSISSDDTMTIELPNNSSTTTTNSSSTSSNTVPTVRSLSESEGEESDDQMTQDQLLGRFTSRHNSTTSASQRLKKSQSMPGFTNNMD